MHRLSSRASEIFRRTNLLYKKVDKLQQLALFGRFTNKERELKVEAQKNVFSDVGMVLSNLTEYNVRRMCGEAVFGAGLQNHMQGRVTDKKVWRDTLSGKLNENGRKWLSINDPQFFESTITLERNSKRPRISGACSCSLASEGSICTHMAALMISWVRKRQDFTEGADYQTVKFEFNETRREVACMLREITNYIENGSSRNDDVWLLQRTYSKLRLWGDEITKGSGEIIVKDSSQLEKELLREFSKTINNVSFDIMTAFENKYKVRTTDLYNKTTVSTFAKVLDLFIGNVDQSIQVDPLRQRNGRRKMKKTLKVPSLATRSWDSFVDNFRGR